MDIEKSELTAIFSIRQAQSLLMFLREIEGMSHEWRGTKRLPLGVMDDVKDIKRDFECALLVADQRYYLNRS
jgi:hypothetical protein